jgi:16S rRNA (cytosine967-C5)-methyltransferase
MVDARNTALKVLNTLDQERQTLDGILEDITPRTGSLSRRDRALFNALIYGVLRWRGRLDYIISHFSNTPLKKIEPGVLNILRLGLFQIIYLDRIPDSAAVNTSVELTRHIGASRAAGFANALLRKAAANYGSVVFPTLKSDPVAFFSTAHSLPDWLARRWQHRYNPETLTALCNAINTIPPITIRTNTLKASRPQLMRSLQDDVEHISPAPDAPDGITMNKLKRSIPDLPAFKKGWFQVQDEAAQLVSLLINPQPEESVLDACAGLGGKTAHIAQLMRNKGNIAAVDKDEKKLQQLDKEMRRLDISIVHPTCHDLNLPLDIKQQGDFDRILLDAPCSGLGVLRRNPDIKWKSSEAALKRHAGVQKQFLDNLAPLAKPNGILVYAVCSIEPEENEAVIAAFLKKHPEFVIDKSLGKLPKTLHSMVEPATGFKTLPLLNHMDGFYFVRLKKIK